MKMSNVYNLVFLVGLLVLIGALLVDLPFAQGPQQTGQAILEHGPQVTGAANSVTSVVLAYRGLDTLGELTILFIAATAAGLIMGKAKARNILQPGGFILKVTADLLFPFLLLLGMYIILHGHLTPGGGFQGGVILAIAFFLPLLSGSNSAINENLISVLEGLAGGAFIVIGMLSLLKQEAFLTPLLGKGHLGDLFSAGSLPILYLAVGLKVGSEMAGLMSNMLHEQEQPDV
jgi:multicomponent Na+:H+ antiporter subunit B